MSLDNYVQIQITANTVGISRLGFGTPAILSHNATFPGLSKVYTSSLSVADDFATDSPEYLCSVKLLSQENRPPSILVLKAPSAPTQAYKITPIAQDDTEYKLTVKGEGVTETEVAYTSDGTALVTEITAALKAALDLVPGANYTTVDNGTDVDITGAAAGSWFSLAVDNPALLEIEQTHADPGLAADLNAIVVAENSWYELITLYNSAAYVKAAAAWVETAKKAYHPAMSESDIIQEASTGSACTADELKTLGYNRTGVFYHPDPSAFADAAWAGRMLPTDPGSATWMFKQLAGVAAVALDATQRANLVAKNGNSYEVAAPDLSVTFNGINSSGRFIDIQRGIDWLENAMQTAVVQVLVDNNKVPYTGPGQALIQGAMEGTLREGVQQTLLLDDDNLLVTAPALDDISVSDRSNRTMPDMDFSATLQAGIHKVLINGTVSV